MAFPPLLANEAGKRLIFQVDDYVIRRSGQHGLLGFIERIGFNVVNIGWDEKEVPRTGVHILFKILAKINPYPPFQYISGSLGLTVMVGRALIVGSGGNQAQPNLRSPGAARHNSRAPDHASGLGGGGRVLGAMNDVGLLYRNRGAHTILPICLYGLSGFVFGFILKPSPSVWDGMAPVPACQVEI